MKWIWISTASLLAGALVLGGAARAGESPAESKTPPHTIDPGYWSYHASTFVGGIANGEHCVRADQVMEFMAGPHNSHYNCTYPEQTVGEGKVAFNGVCTNRKGTRSYRIMASGAYKHDSFALSGSIRGVLPGIPIPISIKATRLSGVCPVAEQATR